MVSSMATICSTSYLKLVDLANSNELRASNSSILAAMNMAAAPTSCHSDLETLGTAAKYLSVRVTAMWKV